MAPYGITARMLAAGLVCPTWQIRLHPSGDRAVFDLSVLKDDSEHPYRLQCEQAKYCAFVLEAVRKLPSVTVHFSTPVAALEQSGDNGAGASRRRDIHRRLCHRRRRRAERGAARHRRGAVRRHLSRDHDPRDHALSVPRQARRAVQRLLLLEAGRHLQPAAAAGRLAGQPLCPRGPDHRAGAGGRGAAGSAARHRSRCRPDRGAGDAALSHPPAARLGLSQGPRVPGRRRGASQQPVRRHGHERRHPRRVQSLREADRA